MDDYPVEFLLRAKRKCLCVFFHPVDTNKKISRDALAGVVIEGNNISIIMVVEVFFIDLKQIIIRTKNNINFSGKEAFSVN